MDLRLYVRAPRRRWPDVFGAVAGSSLRSSPNVATRTYPHG